MTRLQLAKPRLRLEPDPPARFWSAHTHSRYSANDAMPRVEEIVARAKELNYPGLGLTDHGNMAGSIELYRACVQAGIKPFPGSEMYLVDDRNDKKAHRYHLCLLAYTSQGYRNLIKISTDTHKNFYHKPLLDFADMARYHDLGWTEGIALLTGCFFGLAVQSLIHNGYDSAKQVIAAYASWFDTYVEVQNHQIVREDSDEREIATALVAIADELGLEVVLTQDSHYVTEDERRDHDTLKRLVSFGTDLDDTVFPGDGFHLVDDRWMRRHHGESTYERGVRGLGVLLAKHDLTIPEADDYHYRVPALSSDPDRALRQRCFKALARKNLIKKRYTDRLDEELEIVRTSGMAPYLLLVAAVCDFMRSKQIFYQTRGSAAGSLACWMLGITNLDPIRWGARMDRFLSRDRTAPPDIDLDVEHVRRKEVMDWIAERYAVVQVTTWGELGMNPDEKGKGSLKIKYFSKRRQILREQKQEVPPDNWASVPAEDKRDIFRLASRQCFGGYGVHACALALLTTRTELEEMLPLQYVASSKTFVTQYNGKVVESLGVIKLDVLGSKTMSVLHECCRNLGLAYADLDNIPYDSSKVYAMLCRGDTDGVFQLEGATSQRGCRELQPRRIGEVIDAMALFRPATRNSGAQTSYINRKFGSEELPQRHDLIMKYTGNTRGVLLYQDQIIAILRDLGMEPEDLTRFLKAVKASNKNTAGAKGVIDHYLPHIHRMSLDRGMGEQDWDWLQGAFKAFADYSFNVAHATVYGICAYRTAYLATHYPVEFHAGLLHVAAGTDKEAQYLRVTRRRAVRVRRPDLNSSGMEYAMDKTRKFVRKGFLSLDGIGIAIGRALVRGQPYADWEDFVEKSVGTRISGLNDFHTDQTSPDQLLGTIKTLYEAGVLKDSIGQPPFGPGYVKKSRRKKEVEGHEDVAV